MKGWIHFPRSCPEFTPMRIGTAFRRLVNAATVYLGRHGAVQQLADQRQTSRQALYREAQQTLTAVEGSATAAQVDDLRRQLAQRDAQIAQREARLPQAIPVDRDRRAEFAATAQARRLSPPQTPRPLACLPPAATPRVAPPA